MSQFWTPQLLCPAGSLSKLKTAVSYGAQGVYLSGQHFGLRAASENFTRKELEEGVDFAHTRGSDVHLAINGFLQDDDIKKLPPFISFLDSLGVDAIIVSDLGAVETLKDYTDIPLHLSTQASCLNADGAALWKKFGISRIILGREASIEEAKTIKEETGMEIEMFIHGSLCTAYSGNCVISNFTRGRDSNRGGCAHSCRFEYHIDLKRKEEHSSKKSFFMSSKDLQGIGLLKNFLEAGVDCLKIEGRMKGPHYVATVTKVYSEALTFYKKYGHFESEDFPLWKRELTKVTRRDQTEASLLHPANSNSLFLQGESKKKHHRCVGHILEKFNDVLFIEVRGQFSLGEGLEIIPFKGENISLVVEHLFSFDNSPLEHVHPGMVVKLPYKGKASVGNILRKEKVS